METPFYERSQLILAFAPVAASLPYRPLAFIQLANNNSDTRGSAGELGPSFWNISDFGEFKRFNKLQNEFIMNTANIKSSQKKAAPTVIGLNLWRVAILTTRA